MELASDGAGQRCNVDAVRWLPFYPEAESLIRLADKESFTHFGTSAKYIAALEKFDVKPNTLSEFPALRAIFSTGSPLAHESFEYVYRDWKSDLLLASISGGTDIVSCFVLSIRLHRFMSDKSKPPLGMNVQILDEQGTQKSRQGKGELTCATAFPSMPLAFGTIPMAPDIRRRTLIALIIGGRWGLRRITSQGLHNPWPLRCDFEP